MPPTLASVVSRRIAGSSPSPSPLPLFRILCLALWVLWGCGDPVGEVEDEPDVETTPDLEDGADGEEVCDDPHGLEDDVCDDPQGVESDVCDDPSCFGLDLEDYESPLQIRIMAANITSGNYQSYDDGPGVRIFQALRPDIVVIQEFNYGDDTPADIRELVRTAFGPEFYYSRGVGSIPNGVISRFPIVDQGYWPSPAVTNRSFDWAEIDLPGTRDLLAVSVHLHTDDHNSEMDDLADDIQDLIRGRNLYVVLGGDFNTNSRGTAEDQFDHLFEVGDPYPADEDGVEGTNAARTKPYDWLLVNPALDRLEIDVVIGSNRFPDGLVFDSRVYNPLSEVSPVQRDDSDAFNMQHMAVVRDFRIQF